MTLTDTFTPQDVEPPDDQEQSRGGSKRVLLLAVGVAAAAGVGAALYFMLGVGSGGDDAQFRLAPTVTTPNAQAPSTAPVVPVTPTKIGSRDPFKALKPGAVAAPIAAADTTSATSSGNAGSASSVGSAPAPASSVTVSVTSINPTAQTAVIDIDGKKYATGVGKVFAQKYSVYSVFNAQCVGLLYGSSSTPVCIATPVTITP